jgi:uncharacterized protein (DUF488 family)
MAELPPIHTIGHSTRTIAAFVDLLRLGGVRLVVDIRSVPRSRTNPQFNLESLPASLAECQLDYIHLAELGGLRKRAHAIPAEVNGFWINRSFHNYADYALTDDFGRGLSQLLGLAAEMRCAIMCAEAVWWRCHRRIVADYLLFKGRSVIHLMGTSRIEPAKITPAARIAGGMITYPADASQLR